MITILSKAEIERKFQESGMENVLKTCKSQRIDRYDAPVKKKREHGFVYRDDRKETVAVIYYFEEPDGTELRSIRLMVIDGITYKVEDTPPKLKE